MAIQINAELDNGVILGQGYFRIESIFMDTKLGETAFSGALYASKEAKDAGKSPVQDNFYANRFTPNDKNGNLVAQSYEYIKLLAAEFDNEKEIFNELIDC